MWFVFLTPDALCCHAKNLIQYQVKESQCSQSGEGSAHNLDKAMVPVRYSRANYQRSKPSGISRRVERHTSAFIFGVKFDEKWFNYLQTNLKSYNATDRGLIWGAVVAFVWRDWGRTKKISDLMPDPRADNWIGTMGAVECMASWVELISLTAVCTCL